MKHLFATPHPHNMTSVVLLWLVGKHMNPTFHTPTVPTHTYRYVGVVGCGVGESLK